MISKNEISGLFLPVHAQNVTASETIFVNDTLKSFIVNSVSVRFGTASTSGTLQIEVAGAAVAVGSGTSQLSSTISLAGTANTNNAGSLIGQPTVITPGAALNAVLGGTLTNLANCCITIELQEL